MHTFFIHVISVLLPGRIQTPSATDTACSSVNLFPLICRSITTANTAAVNASAVLRPTVPIGNSRSALPTDAVCYDVPTGLKQLVKLTAPPGHWVISPLSTLQVAMMDISARRDTNGNSSSVEDLLSATTECLINAFQLPTSFIIGKTDCYRYGKPKTTDA
jgi:hypothetical protein